MPVSSSILNDFAPMIVDSHCHLNFPVFADQLDDVIARAHGADVKLMQTICTRLDEFEDIHAITRHYPSVFCSVGVHPNHVAEDGVVATEELLARAQKSKVIGIGETGLDYYYGQESKLEQQRSFRHHIHVARQLGLPVIVHSRAADEDTLAILQEEMGQGAFKGLIHCFSSGADLAYGAIELGMYISISGIITFKNAEALRDIVVSLPAERLLVETDAPYLAPVPYRGQTNEPSYTRKTAQYLAELKKLSYEEIFAVTTKNFFALFDCLTQGDLLHALKKDGM